MTTLQALITKLETEEGSREIDAEIASFLGWSVHPMGLWRNEKGEDVDGPPPHWSTSLDAALPGENIVAVHLRIDNRWQATHGRYSLEFKAEANTEILARRLACLKAMADE